MIQLIIIFSIILLIIFREGFQLADKIKPSKKLSSIWHGVGFTIRGLIFTWLYLIKVEWYILTASIILMWPIYNIACSIGLGHKWYYVSKNGFDGIIRKIFPFINFDK